MNPSDPDAYGPAYEDAINNLSTSFMDLVQQIVNVLDYTGLEEYRQSKMMF